MESSIHEANLIPILRGARREVVDALHYKTLHGESGNNSTPHVRTADGKSQILKFWSPRLPLP